MKNYEIRRDNNTLSVTLRNEHGSMTRQCDHALTASQAAILLGKSLRHLYRYIDSGSLTPMGKFLGEWLFDENEVVRFKSVLQNGRIRLTPFVIPSRYQGFFPEYAVKELNPWTNAPLVISRILDMGGRKEWKWVFESYPHSLIRSAVTRHGERLMGTRSRHFWLWLLKIRSKPDFQRSQNWRKAGSL